MVIVSLPVHVHVDVHVHVHDGERAIRSEERTSRQKPAKLELVQGEGIGADSHRFTGTQAGDPHCRALERIV